MELCPNPVPRLLEVADQRQPRAHRLHQRAVLPLPALTPCEIVRIPRGGMEGGIAQDNHPLFKAPIARLDVWQSVAGLKALLPSELPSWSASDLQAQPRLPQLLRLPFAPRNVSASSAHDLHPTLVEIYSVSSLSLPTATPSICGQLHCFDRRETYHGALHWHSRNPLPHALNSYLASCYASSERQPGLEPRFSPCTLDRDERISFSVTHDVQLRQLSGLLTLCRPLRPHQRKTTRGTPDLA